MFNDLCLSKASPQEKDITFDLKASERKNLWFDLEFITILSTKNVLYF